MQPTGSYTRNARSYTETIADQGTGHGPASKPYTPDAPSSKTPTIIWRLWQILRPPATPG
ncbi:hypothetical protein HCN51_55920 [Nonomuraea sp. FMUSA5-5]|uniref:Uncharacterized protein n=1 Tax=Nonomuraea composti TaxID=2720023 RepID=A0ABX1BRU8_9ACTN|nr:hypothetical protein [Nonomuraea sp. FMUSA5-5]NJP98614.1 hypothetical protein [Nonomuraea sp. FMUSA5-5]